MASLAELRLKYKMDGSKHGPNPSCSHCQGTGERTIKRTGKKTFCICLYVDHSMSDWVGESLGKIAREALEAMER